jgi:8-oxo-dGTP pyrophosphatase MutT (NUDIX family)
MARIYTSGIIRRGDRFLCIFHRKMSCWLFAGGKLEEGERAEECMIRELREELGIEVVDLEFFRGYLTVKDGTEWVGLFFTIHLFFGEPAIMEPGECGDLQWLTVEEMRQRSACQPEMGIAAYLREV